MELWDLLQSPPAPASSNMAVDEVLLRTTRPRPLLRLYAWTQPAISIGYFQKFPDHLAGQYEIVRRPTGGGLVYHTHDTTYTVVAPPGHTLYEMTTTDAYCAIHRAVAASLTLQSQIANRQPPSPRGTYECFQNPVAGDVVTGDQKLAGGAQRRSRTGMLHQGSIATPVSADQLRQGFQQELHAQFAPYELSATEHQQADRLAREKYATDRWTMRF